MTTEVNPSVAGIPAKPMLTLGEFRVDVSFNPSKFPEVDRIKRASADLIDTLESQRKNIRKDDPLAGEKHRSISHAQTLIEDACMNGVKAVVKNTDVVIIKPKGE